MAPKNFAEIDTGFPIYGLRFINNHTLLTCGGGGEGSNGIPNKVTAIRCSFTVSDKNRRLQKFREITLPSNEDSPMCVEFCRSSPEANSRFQIFIGCNQSTELIRSMNINNNLRKYNYTDDEHLQFQDAVQFDQNLSVESIGEYPKIIHLSTDASIGGMMTSKIPSEIFLFDPNSIELTLKFKPSSPSEIKDFYFDPYDSGKSLTYVTASFIETILSHSANLISSSSDADKKTAKILGKYFFSKVRYVGESKVVITAASRNGKGAALLEYNTSTRKVSKELVISSKIKGIVAIDISASAGLIAVAGNDFSVTLVRLADFKIVKTYAKLHKFAVTCLSFSPDGKKLATGSASNTLSVILITSSGGILSFILSVFRLLIVSCVILSFAIYAQHAHDKGDLDLYIDLSKTCGTLVMTHARHLNEIGKELSQKYGKECYNLGQQYGKLGLSVAKEQASKGMEILREQVMKRRNPEKEPSTALYSSMPEWVNESTERTLTERSDVVGDYTKDVHELTKLPGPKDTLSIINQATRLSTLGTTTQSESIFSLDTPEEISSEIEISQSRTLSDDESPTQTNTPQEDVYSTEAFAKDLDKAKYSDDNDTTPETNNIAYPDESISNYIDEKAGENGSVDKSFQDSSKYSNEGPSSSDRNLRTGISAASAAGISNDFSKTSLTSDHGSQAGEESHATSSVNEELHGANSRPSDSSDTIVTLEPSDSPSSVNLSLSHATQSYGDTTEESQLIESKEPPKPISVEVEHHTNQKAVDKILNSVSEPTHVDAGVPRNAANSVNPGGLVAEDAGEVTPKVASSSIGGEDDRDINDQGSMKSSGTSEEPLGNTLSADSLLDGLDIDSADNMSLPKVNEIIDTMHETDRTTFTNENIEPQPTDDSVAFYDRSDSLSSGDLMESHEQIAASKKSEHAPRDDDFSVQSSQVNEVEATSEDLDFSINEHKNEHDSATRLVLHLDHRADDSQQEVSSPTSLVDMQPPTTSEPHFQSNVTSIAVDEDKIHVNERAMHDEL